MKNENLLNHFLEISKIPRNSTKEKEIANYLYNFFNKYNPERIFIDDQYNLFAKFKATPGLEDKPRILLQAHSDIVWAKTHDSNHNFERDGIKVIIDGDKVRADKTTLGADDGIGLAYIMEIVSSNEIKHGPLTVLITANEENGIIGLTNFKNLENEISDCKYGFNIDSTSCEKIIIGSCSGLIFESSKDVVYEKLTSNEKSIKLSITNLIGGHSGAYIHKMRLNSIILTGEILFKISKISKVKICQINGGTLSNAIAQECETIFTIEENKYDQVQEIINKVWTSKKEQFLEEKNFLIKTSSVKDINSSLSEKDSREIISALFLCYNGVFGWNVEINVYNSSCNLGIIRTENNKVKLLFYGRGSKDFFAEEIFSKNKFILEINNFNVKQINYFPSWPVNGISEFAKFCASKYLDVLNINPKFEVLPSGLEPSLLSKANKSLQIVSICCDIYGEHTPSEYFSLSNFYNFFNVILEIIKDLK